MISSGNAKKQRKNPNDLARFIAVKAATNDGEAAKIHHYLDENRIGAHFPICFLALLSYRILEKKLDYKYTCEEVLDILKTINFAEVQEQGYIFLYKRSKLTDALYDACAFRTDYQFIIKSQMKQFKRKVNVGNKIP